MLVKNEMHHRLKKLRAAIDEQEIDYSKLEKEMSEEVEKLSFYYIFPIEEGGMPYHFSELGDYLDDFFLRNVGIAKDYIVKAFKENATAANKLFMEKMIDYQKTVESHKELMLELYQAIEVGRKEKEREENADEDLLAYHYLGLQDDPDRIEYNVRDAEKYVRDWERGIAQAEDYIIKVIKDDYRKLIVIVNSLSDLKFAENLLDLILKNLQVFKDILVVAGITFKKRIIKCLRENDPVAAASVLEEADNMGEGALEEILGMSSGVTAFTHNLITSNVLPHIKDLDVSIRVHRLMGLNDKILERNLYLGLFTPDCKNHDVRLEFLKKLQNEQAQLSKPTQQSPQSASKHELNKKVVVSLKDDIRFDFYIASYLTNTNALLDMAYQKNPMQFAALFSRELKDLSNIPNAIKKREGFYRTLMANSDMVHFPHYQSCLDAVNTAFSSAGLAPIVSTAVTVIVPAHLDHSELEEGKEFYRAGKKGNDDVPELEFTPIREHKKKQELKPSLLSSLPRPSLPNFSGFLSPTKKAEPSKEASKEASTTTTTNSSWSRWGFLPTFGKKERVEEMKTIIMTPEEKKKREDEEKQEEKRSSNFGND